MRKLLLLLAVVSVSVMSCTKNDDVDKEADENKDGFSVIDEFPGVEGIWYYDSYNILDEKKLVQILGDGSSLEGFKTDFNEELKNKDIYNFGKDGKIYFKGFNEETNEYTDEYETEASEIYRWKRDGDKIIVESRSYDNVKESYGEWEKEIEFVIFGDKLKATIIKDGVEVIDYLFSKK